MLQLIFNHISRFRAWRPPGQETGLEKRQSLRLYTNLPVECRAVLRDQAGTFATRALMKNISQRGAYLECATQPHLIEGVVGHFTFRATASQWGGIQLAATARVRRIDQRRDDRSSFGLAVEFLAGPLIFYRK